MGNEVASKQRCGEFCKKLGPEEQRKVIQRLMLQQHRKQLQEEEINNQTESSQVWTDLSGEVGLSPALIMPNNQTATVQETQRYLISSKWWEQWRDFSNYNADFIE